MQPNAVLRRTALGHEELSHRVLGLSQRHRTALLLINGNRSAEQLRQLGLAAGVPELVFDELLAWHLVEGAVPQDVQHIELPLQAPAPGVDTTETTLLPTLASLLPDSSFSDSLGLDASRPPLEQARSLLEQALQEAAPWSGALLARRVRRAVSPAEMAALCDEVHGRVHSSGHASLRAAQAVRQARHLLASQPASAR